MLLVPAFVGAAMIVLSVTGIAFLDPLTTYLETMIIQSSGASRWLFSAAQRIFRRKDARSLARFDSLMLIVSVAVLGLLFVIVGVLDQITGWGSG